MSGSPRIRKAALAPNIRNRKDANKMSTGNITPLRAANASNQMERKIKPSMALGDQIAILSDLIKNPPENSRIIEVSPKLAEYVLTELNDKNRPMKPTKIKTYAEDLSG